MFTVNLNHRVEVELCVMFVDLEYRIDYQLREASFSNSYISMLTSHTSYWTDRDVAFFVLSHIHPELQDLWQPRSAEFHLKTLYYNFITQVYKSSCLYLSLYFNPTNFCSKRIFFYIYCASICSMVTLIQSLSSITMFSSNIHVHLSCKTVTALYYESR